MSWLGNIFGINPNGQGPGFTAQGVNPGELAQAQGQTQAGIGQQQSLAQALQAQNGIGNQSAIFSQMQGTAGQLQNVANGQGPNPALAQLAQTTQQNIRQQAALQAGQRGASANAGLIARQAAQQGGALQQQAAGQAATQAAQQQLAGLGALQSQEANLANLATTQVGQQTGAVQGYNAAVQGNQGQLLGGQANQNTVNSAIAQANQKAGQGLIGGVLGGTSTASLAGGGMVRRMADGGVTQVQVPGGGGPQSFAGRYLSAPPPPAAPSMPSSEGGTRATGLAIGALGRRGFDSVFGTGKKPAPGAPAQDFGPGKDALTFEQQMNLEGMQGGGAGAGEAADPAASTLSTSTTAGSAAEGATDAAAAGAAEEAGGEELAALLVARGGRIPNFDQGGSPNPQDPNGAIGDILQDIMSHLAKGGRIMKVPAMLSPDEIYLTPAKARAVADGKASPMTGKRVPGKAKVPGDSLKNDVVPAKLEPGGVVIPRSKAKPGDEDRAAKFVAAVLSRQTMKRRAS